MKTLTTYHRNDPTSADGHTITLTTVVFGTEEEINNTQLYFEAYIGTGLVTDYDHATPTEQLNFKPEDIKRIREMWGLDGGNDNDKDN